MTAMLLTGCASQDPDSFIEIVLDRTELMQAPFDESGNKLEAAVEYARRTVSQQNENLGIAIRTFGGGCSVASDLIVRDASAATGAAAELAAIAAVGRGSLLAAVNDALEHVASLPNRMNKSVVVIAGGYRPCESEVPVGEVTMAMRRLNEKGTSVDVTFVVLSPESAPAAELIALSRALDGDLYVAQSSEQLEGQRRFTMVVGPPLGPFYALVRHLNDVTVFIDRMASKLSARDPSIGPDLRAANALRQAHSFSQCPSPQATPEVPLDDIDNLFALSCENHERQGRLLALAELMVTDSDFSSHVQEWNTIQTAYEANRQRIRSILAQRELEGEGVHGPSD